MISINTDSCFLKFARCNLKALHRRHVCKVSYLLILSQANDCDSQKRPGDQPWQTHAFSPVTELRE